jgi:ABC-type nitrate/sulfonate/bicarbonate transport system substrate-binding protein
MKKHGLLKTVAILSLAIALAAGLAACGGGASSGGGSDTDGADTAQTDGAQDLKKITFVLDWTPNTNHTGVYAAKELGYYEEAGLDVEIIQPSDNTADQLVAVGQADFGISTQENVTYALTQDEPLPIKTVATVIQHNTSGFIWLPDSGIKSPADWKGKTYGGWGSVTEEKILEYILKKNGLTLDDINIVTLGADDVITALNADIDFVWIFEGWEGVRLRNEGIEFEYLPIIDIDAALDNYTPTIIANTGLIEEDPDTVKAFVEATAKGYQYAIDDPAGAAEALITAVPELDGDLVKASAEFLAGKYAEGAPQWGWQDEKIWRDYSAFFFESGAVTSELDIAKAYTNEFLPAQ